MAKFCKDIPTIIILTQKATCGHCKDLEVYIVPTLIKLNGPKIHVVHYDSGDKDKVIQTFEALETVPTILIFYPKQLKLIKYTGPRDTKQGQKTVNDIVNFAINREYDSNQDLIYFPLPKNYTLVDHHGTCGQLYGVL